MSKKAEELARRFVDVVTDEMAHIGDMPITRAEIAIRLLIDAELRKERERCAEKASTYFDLRLANEPICPTNWKAGLHVAILLEDEP